jgi:hypothetical protein
MGWYFLNAFASYAFYLWILGLMAVLTLRGFSALQGLDTGGFFIFICVLNIRSMEKSGLQVWPFLLVCDSKVFTVRFYWGIPIPFWFNLQSVQAIKREGEARFAKWVSYPIIKVELSDGRRVVLNTLLGEERLKKILRQS